MPFDNDLELHDGTEITEDISPTSTTRASGSAVIDLKKTGKKGLVAHLLMAGDLYEADDTLVVSIEGCATVDGTYEEITRFPTITYDDDTPHEYTRRFSTDYRYIRAKINVTDDDDEDDFSASDCYILLSTTEL